MTTPPLLTKALVAIVDDNAQFRRAMSRVLEAAGFEPKAFGSVVDFINSGILVRIQCLVLDVNMPGISGFSLQECIRSTNYDLPIVFCSGAADDDVRGRAIAGGAVSFLRKPVTAEQLIIAVTTACASRKPVNETRAAPTS